MVKADGVSRGSIWPQLLNIKSFNQFTVHKEKLIKLNNIGTNVHLAEVCVKLLVSPMLENLLSFVLEETSDFLNTRLLFKELGVLELRSVLWVVSHKVLSKENARVEPSADAWINFILAFLIG